MGNILTFPISERGRGTIHVYPAGDSFEIAHESSSGGSWGHFQQFPGAEEAIAAAYRLNRDVLGNSCAVCISPGVLAALPHGGA